MLNHTTAAGLTIFLLAHQVNKKYTKKAITETINYLRQLHLSIDFNHTCYFI